MYYTRSAATYDWRTSYETAHHREAIQRIGIREGDHVLEVACGTGRATVELAQQVGQMGKLDALDLTQAMMARAQEKIRGLGLQQRVEFRTGNANHLPYEDGAFDVLYNAYMFDLIPVEQFTTILTEFKRVLKPGGRLMLVNMSKDRGGKTLYEALYRRGLAGACRPVALSGVLNTVGFESITRQYRRNVAGIIPLPFGTEIVSGRKAITA